jgi:hypothetical protein
MILIGLSALSVTAILVGNYLFNLYVDDMYEQNVNTCTYDDYELAERLA